MPKVWKSKLFAQFPELNHGSTSKDFGIIRFGSASIQEVIINRSALYQEIGVDSEKTFMLNQVHGNKVIHIKAGDDGNAFTPAEGLLQADAMITDQPGRTLLIKSADCVPILFFHPQRLVVAAAHAGWHGTNTNIVQEVLRAMKDEYNTDSLGMYVTMGPSICGDCYDVSQTTDGRIGLFEKLFNSDPQIIIRNNDKISLNLSEANKQLLIKAGVPEAQIEMSDVCTYEDSNYASYRRAEGELANKTFTYISM